MLWRNIWRISARLRWIAGTRKWEGRSWPSCTMSSARSVSTAAIPASVSASFVPSSWVVMDFTFTTSAPPAWRTRLTTIRLASTASLAQWTTPPAAVTDSSNWMSRPSRFAMVAALISRPAWRSSSQSSISATAA